MKLIKISKHSSKIKYLLKKETQAIILSDCNQIILKSLLYEKKHYSFQLNNATISYLSVKSNWFFIKFKKIKFENGYEGEILSFQNSSTKWKKHVLFCNKVVNWIFPLESKNLLALHYSTILLHHSLLKLPNFSHLTISSSTWSWLYKTYKQVEGEKMKPSLNKKYLYQGIKFEKIIWIYSLYFGCFPYQEEIHFRERIAYWTNLDTILKAIHRNIKLKERKDLTFA